MSLPIADISGGIEKGDRRRKIRGKDGAVSRVRSMLCSFKRAQCMKPKQPNERVEEVEDVVR